MISVLLPTHNPSTDRLARALNGLHSQTLSTEHWELLLIDNASTDRRAWQRLDISWHPRARLVSEPQLGLTHARLRGFAEGHGDLFVLVDDDNVLAPNYLARVREHFAADPSLGCAGGKSRPVFDEPPPAWATEFYGLLAVRDSGETPCYASWIRDEPRRYPDCAPIGAGMALRRAGAEAYAGLLARDAHRAKFDRTGAQLVSGGDNDLVMTVLETGARVAYLPDLVLTHLIPPSRTQRQYLGALNRAIARSWVRVLALHGIQPWPAVTRASVKPRQWRAWFRTAAWRGPAQWVRWQGRCGLFEGQADLRGM